MRQRVRAALAAIGRRLPTAVEASVEPAQPQSAGAAPANRGISPAVVDAKVATFLGILNGAGAPAPDAGPLIETEEITSVVGRCVECIAEDFAACPIQLFDVTDREQPVEIFEHPFLELFENINPVWQPNLFWQHVIGDLLTEGNSFTWLDLRGGTGDPQNLLRIRPQQMHVVPSPTKIVGGYVMLDEEYNEHPYKTIEIMHVRTRNLTDPYRGLGKLARLRQTILIDREIKNAQYYRFKNGLPVGLLIQSETGYSSEEELQALSDSISSRFRGSENTGKPMFFKQGQYKIEQIARPSEEEIGFIKSMNWSREDIAMVFGVPPSRLSIYSDVRANSDIEIRSYWEDTIQAMQRLVLGYLNGYFLKTFWGVKGARLEARFDLSKVRALQKSEKDVADVNTVAVNGGWMTVNEARERAGMDAYEAEEADKLYKNGKPIDKWDEDPMAALAAAGAGPFAPKPGEKPGEKKPPEKKPPEKKAAALRVIPNRLLNPEEEAELIRKKVRAIIEEMYRISGEELLQVSKVPGGSVGFDISDPNVLRFIETQAIRLSQSVVNTTVEMVRAAIAEAIHEGRPIPAMRESIQEAFKERRADWQLDRIARTETHQAQNAAGWLAAKQNGIEYKQWLTSRDARVRGTDPKDTSDHVMLEGKVLGMDEAFVDERSGARMLFPGDGDNSGPGDVINCRCNWVADFSHLGRDWQTPDFDGVWTRRATTLSILERALRRFFERELLAMEERALAELDRQTAQAAA